MLLHGIYRARYRAGHQVDADSHRHLNTNANRAAADPYAAADQSVLYGDHHPLAQPDHYLDTVTDVHAVLDLHAHTNRSADADGNPAPDGRPDGDANHHAHPERDTTPNWTAMSEAETVQRSELPVTRSAIAADLAALGVKPGMTLLVHSSLSSIGWVPGGAQAVILALEDVLTPEGTLVMPSFSSQISEPSYWGNPPVPEAWFEIIRRNTPGYRPDLTPTRGMGAIVESFRSQDGVVRSSHPNDSFAAWGADKHAIIASHELAYGLGDHGPLGKLYEKGAYVLLLGVGYGNCTSLHLAEHRATWPGKEIIMRGNPILVDGNDVWVTFEDWLEETDDFVDIGAAFEAENQAYARGKIGSADALLIYIPALVDFATQWMNTNRK